mmetsp:Transcript_16619/g.31426  ORF Transcript_16619/g.31426 Transcript_16619/m.31426 type:complete len:99 (-) Transcript_16619:117-413(-)
MALQMFSCASATTASKRRRMESGASDSLHSDTDFSSTEIDDFADLFTLRSCRLLPAANSVAPVAAAITCEHCVRVAAKVLGEAVAGEAAARTSGALMD